MKRNYPYVMNNNDLFKLYVDCMDEIRKCGINDYYYDTISEIKFNGRIKNCGVSSTYSRKDANGAQYITRQTIDINKQYSTIECEDDWKDLKNTLVHEIFHCLSGFDFGHDGTWANMAKVWNKQHKDKHLKVYETAKSHEKEIKEKYHLICDYHGEERIYKYMRACSVVKTAKCGGAIYVNGEQVTYRLVQNW